MSERIPQSVAYLVVFRAFLASDGKTPATGKTIAITISKNGALTFSNPAAGATNATEMASGFYKFTLGTGDTDTLGPLAWRGAEGTINDAGDVLTVAAAVASQASVDDLPTNAELATALGTADDATLAAIAALSIPTADQNADALLDRAAGVETNRTPRQALRLMLAALAGKLSGGATTTVSIRDTNDSKDRIIATVDADGNRSAVTLDAS